MKETIKSHSKLIALLLGLVNGIAGGIVLVRDTRFLMPHADDYVVVVMFGLLAPPIGAMLNNRFGRRLSQIFYRKVNSYVNLYILISTAALSQGITSILLIAVGRSLDGALLPAVFFTSGGLGFLIAYFLDSVIGYRSEQCLTRRCS